MAAWAVVGRNSEGRWSRAGPCPGLQTIGRAELAAVAHVLVDAEPGTIVTDCLGIKTKCVAILRGQVPMEAVLKGANADLWWEVWQALRKVPGWTFDWLPSHRSLAEAAAAGLSAEDWLGKERADDAAKAQARAADISPLLLTRWAANRAAVEAVWRLTDC